MLSTENVQDLIAVVASASTGTGSHTFTINIGNNTHNEKGTTHNSGGSAGTGEKNEKQISILQEGVDSLNLGVGRIEKGQKDQKENADTFQNSKLADCEILY